MNSNLIQKHLCCPQCHDSLKFNESEGLCQPCQRNYPLKNDLVFTQPDTHIDMTLLQKFMQNGAVAKIYENYWRPIGFYPLKGAFSKQEEIDFFLESLPKEPGVILDLCCGPGYFTENLAEKLKFSTIIGFDLSPAMLDEALKRNGKAKYLQGSVYELPFKKEAITGILCAGAFHLLENLEKLFSEVSRVLETGGTFTGFFVKKTKNPLVSTIQGMTNATWGLIFWERSQILELAENSGLRLVKMEKHHLSHYFCFQKS